MRRQRASRWAGLIVVCFGFVACTPRTTRAPQTTPEAPALVSETPEERELERVAQMAHHRMELSLLEEGSYTTNALLDLQLPSGTQWTLEDFGESSYLIRFISDRVPDIAWLVSPEGIAATPR